MNSKEFSRFLHKRISIARIVEPAFYPRLYSAPYAVMFAQEKSESPKLLYGAVERIYNLVALCPLKPVSETEIQQAFLSVYNKLQANQSYILQPIIDTLLQLRFLQEQANSARQTARDDVQRLAKQRHNLTRIHTLGYIDNAQFLERSIALDQQLREKKKFLSKRTTDNSFERVLFQTRSIQQQLGSSPPLETFDGTIFTKLVNRVQVSPTTIEFKFMNGMTLSEKRSSL